MRLTTKGRYAVTAMMDLAIHEVGGPVTLTDIASSQNISLSVPADSRPDSCIDNMGSSFCCRSNSRNK